MGGDVEGGSAHHHLAFLRGNAGTSGGVEGEIMSLQMSDRSLTELMKMERPVKRMFRVVVSADAAKDGMQKLRVFSCDRVVSSTRVWREEA